MPRKGKAKGQEVPLKKAKRVKRISLQLGSNFNLPNLEKPLRRPMTRKEKRAFDKAMAEQFDRYAEKAIAEARE